MTPDYQTLFQSLPGLYLVLSPDLTIVVVSDAYLAATLTKREEITGKALFSVFTDDPNDPSATGVANLRTSLNRVLASKLADAMAVQKYSIQLPEGGFEERFWSPINSPVLSSNKKELLYIIHRVEDVTEFISLKEQEVKKNKITSELQQRTQQMETEIFRRAQEIQEANQKLREAEKLKSEFFANVSHELRTPLSLVLGPLETVLSEKYGELNPNLKTSVRTVHNNAVRLLQMVNGLLDFAKFEAGKMKVERESTDVKNLVSSVLNDFSSLLDGKKIELIRQLDLKQNYVMLDRYLFERILFNLLSNAAKFTPENGTVTVKASQKNGDLFLSVEDTGIGIAPEDQKLLFQKFRQVEGSSSRRFDGTGLGLAMVKEFSEMMDGSVGLQSTPGKGSIFTVRLSTPAAAGAPRDDDPMHKRPSLVPQFNIVQTESQFEEASAVDAHMKVLVCEDNDELRTYIVSLLNGHCDVKTARNGIEGLEIAKSWQPDLVLSDVMMPQKDGIQLCHDIKSDPLISKTGVVLLTALTHRDALIRGWEAKADDYLFKPFHPDELVSRIKALLLSIKERKDASDALEVKNKELRNAYSEMEAFSYSVSHDLRAPIRIISASTQILREESDIKLDAETLRLMDSIDLQVRQMDLLITDLLALSQLGRKTISKTTVDMNELTRYVQAEMEKTGELRAQIKVHHLEPAFADVVLMKQVMLNLLGNAVKYSGKVQQPIVEVSSMRGTGEITYCVSDNGAGFDMKYRHKLFGVFQRLHRADEFEGTGIGLAIVHRIISKHGGRIWAEAELGKGARFYFTLPAVPL